MTEDDSLDRFVRSYLETVVNQRDTAAVTAMVATDYAGRGHGWPQDRPALIEFYQWQAATRPDWRVDVQATVELGDCVVVRALAGGTIARDEHGRPTAAPSSQSVEWLAAYRVRDRLITGIEVLAVVERATT